MRAVGLRAVPKKREFYHVSQEGRRPKNQDGRNDRQRCMCGNGLPCCERPPVVSVKETSRCSKAVREASISNKKRPVGLRAVPKKRQLFQVTYNVNQPKHTASDKTIADRQLRNGVTAVQLKSKKSVSPSRKISLNKVCVDYSMSALKPADPCEDNVKEQEHGIGELVWALIGRYPWWPAIVVPGSKAGFSPAERGSSWVLWFGEHKVSKVPHMKIVPFIQNYRKYSSPSKAGNAFTKSLEEVLLECAVRLKNSHLLEKRRKTTGSLFFELDKWASEGFQVNFTRADQNLIHSQENRLPDWVIERLDELYNINRKSSDDESTDDEEECSFRIETIKPGGRLDLVKRNQLKIEEVCIACESSDVVMQHPYFRGGLCESCKEELMDTMFLYGDDGLNFYCIICGNGGTLFVCDVPDCRKVYCTGCITVLVGAECVKLIENKSKWKCYLCSDEHEQSYGLLEKKSDWPQNVIRMYQPDGCHQLNIVADMPKRPMRVLSLFDGIATGKVILDLLDIEVEAYYASEVAEDALTVANYQHGSSVQQLGDIRDLRGSKLADICPIDLVIGGSPCDQFSIVNRQRKGLAGESGLMFLEFARVLSEVKILTRDRPVFWLFENVASMTSDVKDWMSYYLGCSPATWDAIHFSPQQRKRLFWGNIPGLYCPQSLNSVCSPVDLGECLMGPRKAKVKKICTVTTQKNSLMQFKGHDWLPVQMGTSDDILWLPEIERVFGFPAHYTDVADLSPARRRKLLGKAWSVPVVKHLLAPLRQFFMLKE